jgi:hypothetical protein
MGSRGVGEWVEGAAGVAWEEDSASEGRGRREGWQWGSEAGLDMTLAELSVGTKGQGIALRWTIGIRGRGG